MKHRLYAVVIALFATSTLFAGCGFNGFHNPNYSKDFYESIMMVTDVDGDFVTINDGNRDFHFYANTEWVIGDSASVLVNGFGTSSRNDDVVASVLHNHWENGEGVLQ